ncbi:hypothetical protein CEE37_02095 [candidate division LCP-89 bacterium B3_LCP]|uniref:LTD domain-containing protein n=1 Tax=candidate division LCP-89 bacterium B3_LCP TaxID=2012998 RepID=A0A532V5N5_UNCL8|nr:MAG: hypothetical protein CEE37_02095 [candidate division LCP-89 bacterium B3_LCP]
MKSTVIILLTIILIHPVATADVILSEIMFDAPEAEHYEEFIEIFNTSLVAWVDLTGYQIGDQGEQDSLVDCGNGLLLPPESYALILDAGYWGNSAIYDTLIPPDALVLTVNDNSLGAYGLRNDPPDTVILINPIGQTIASISYLSDNDDGYSEEKIRLNEGDSQGNWSNCLSYLGTPGAPNSLLPLDNDLGLYDLQISPSPLPHLTSAEFSALLINQGLFSINGGEVIFALGNWHSSLIDSLMGSVDIGYISAGDSAAITFIPGEMPAGPHRAFAWHINEDDNSDNDSSYVDFIGGYPTKALIINEIFPKTGGNGCEWVELFNPGQSDVNLVGFSFSDEDTTDKAVLLDSSHAIFPSDFVIIAKDSSIFDWNLPPGHMTVLLGSSWPVLNDDGDTPTLFDGASALQDAVTYSDWEILSGISLERVDAGRASNDPANWQISADPAGGSPGFENSIQSPASSLSEAGLVFNPDPFYPDQHGQLQIDVSLPPEASSSTIMVYDLRGRRLRVIGETNLSFQTLFWDGRDSDNRQLPPGIYILFADFRDDSGGRIDAMKKTLIIAGRL